MKKTNTNRQVNNGLEKNSKIGRLTLVCHVKCRDQAALGHVQRGALGRIDAFFHFLGNPFRSFVFAVRMVTNSPCCGSFDLQHGLL